MIDQDHYYEHMKLSLPVMCVCLGVFLGLSLREPLWGQTHTSVSLENQVYYILEQAETRGLCRPLSGVRPYTQGVITAAINEILHSGSAKLRQSERDILEQYLGKFTKPKTGIDWRRGAWYGETAVGKNDVTISANAGISVDMEGSAGLYSSLKDRYFGTDVWIQAFVNGDLGRYVSYDISAEGGLMRVPRRYLYRYNTYYAGFEDDVRGEYVNEEIDVYSEPLTHFPYTYKKRWDSSVFFFRNVSGFDYWPDSAAGGYNLTSELSASFLDHKLIIRLGRLSHDWGSTSIGSSLAFNRMARPFLGVEAEFNPVSWFGIASLTGALEYSNTGGIKESSMPFQNLFSANMLQFRFRNYVFFDVVDTVVYPKRFEFGYISPITSSFFYQNNVGDFDNLAMTFNLKAQYPGWGNIWFSFFMDEMNLTSNLFTLDRQMIAMQGGINIPLPFLSFSSLKLSYTKVNPYTYTHNRNFNPWYGDAMETAYTNNGVSLGYYLPPNADEILVRFNTMPVKSVNAHLQYQLIRHGADFGASAVDGSNFKSELDPDNRDDNLVLKRYFLHDGAYQWSHIARLGAEWNLPGVPIALTGEVGAVISYFTNIKEEANVTGKSHDYSIVDTVEYPKSTGFIVKLGVRVFSR
jgi:hypothetical protein